jgi:hypothetical protein
MLREIIEEIFRGADHAWSITDCAYKIIDINQWKGHSVG